MASAAGLLSPGLVSLVKRAQNIRQEMDPGFLSSSSENIFQSKSYSNKPKPEDIPQIYDNGKCVRVLVAQLAKSINILLTYVNDYLGYLTQNRRLPYKNQLPKKLLPKTLHGGFCMVKDFGGEQNFQNNWFV